LSKRTTNQIGNRVAVVAIAALALGLVCIPAAFAASGGAGPQGSTPASAGSGDPSNVHLEDDPTGECDKIAVYDPAKTPPRIQAALDAGNAICDKPYRLGGGHVMGFEDDAYDCSGTVSYLLHAAGLLKSPLDSGSLARLLKQGKKKRGSKRKRGGKKKWIKGVGNWITVYANGGHTYIVVGDLRMDTSGTGQNGPRWHDDDVHTSTNGPYKILHPKKF
jgi:hypothetical protein